MGTNSMAQTQYTKETSDSITKARQRQVDSMKAERIRITDSTNAARKRIADSTKRHNDSVKIVQQRILDSTRLARQQRLDSLAAVRAYRNSQRYKDSVALVKQQRLDSMKNARTAYNDSLKTVQKRILDSTIAERRRVNDSAKAAQQQFMDSMVAERTRVMDSMKAELTRQKEERQRIIDSTTAARKIITDSLNKIREERKLAREENVKQKEKKKQLALQLEIEKERAAYTNETMRKKGWGPIRRFKQNTTTRYNYVYNANLKMSQALTNMNRNSKDSFNDLIRLFPYNPATDSTRYKGDMDTIIKKAAVGIQIHDPRAKWQDDLYLLVGQAYFYKGDYENASAAFKYIIAENQKNIKEQLKKDRAKQSANGKKEPPKPKTFATVEETGLKGLLTHKAANNEAMMWLARTFVAQGEPQMAQMMLDLLRNDANFPTQLEGRLALEQANIDLATQNWSGASEALTKVMEDSDITKNIRTRAAFLNGQILQRLQQYDKSSEAYAKALDLHPDLAMSFNAQMAIAMNGLKDSAAKGDVNSVLAKMVKDDKYASYNDQIYYVLGSNALENLDTVAAEEYLNLSIAKNTENVKQRGLTFSAIGDMRYQQQQYVSAINAYDSASLYLTKEDQPAYNNAIIRAKMLEKVVEPALVVRTNDSLLRLAALSEPDQRAYIKNYINDLEKFRLDSFYKAQNTAAVNNSNANAAVSTGGGTWYFANPANVQKGAQEFTKKWGNVTLKDNWRRSSNISTDPNNNIAAETENLSPLELIRTSLPNPDSLYALIPKTSTEQQLLKDILEANLYALGKAYFYDLEDAPKAIQTFDTLDAQFAGNKYLPETTYLRYLYALKKGDNAFADEYYQTLKTVYAGEKWSLMVDQKSDENGAVDNSALDIHYQATYQQLLDGNYEIALNEANDVAFKHPILGNYTAKYELIKVMAYAGMREFNKADTLIKGFLTRFANDSLADWGRQVLSYIQKNINNAPPKESINPTSGSSINDANSQNIQSSNEVFQREMANNAISNKYVKEDKTNKFYLIVKLPNDGRMQNVRTQWQNFNNANYTENRYRVSSVEMAKDAILYMREFDDESSVKAYLASIKQQDFIRKDYASNDIKVMYISDKNFATLLAERKIIDYITFFDKNY